MRRERNVHVGEVQQHGRRWRFLVRTGAGQAPKDREWFSYPTHEEAVAKRAAAVRGIREEQRAAAALTWTKAIEMFSEYLTERGCTARTIETAESRLRRFFPEGEQAARLTASEGERAYEDLRRRKGKHGKPYSVQEHRLALRVAKQFSRWMMKSRRWRDDPLRDVEGIGRPKAGEESKAQLNRDEWRKLLVKAIELGLCGDAGAAATVCAALLGMRATSIIDRKRRDLDDGGRILKVVAKRRTVELSLVGDTPEREATMIQVRAVLGIQARSKLPEAPLIGSGHDRWWVQDQVARLCRLAEVSVVSPQGLRGTIESVGRKLGIHAAVLADGLSHSVAVAERSYATAESVLGAKQSAVLAVLTGGGAGSSKDEPKTNQTESQRPVGVPA